MPRRKPTAQRLPQPSLATPLFCFFLSGAAGLIYQVAWTKSLGLLFGHTAYAVATVLAIFLGGLALGSAVLGAPISRWALFSANSKHSDIVLYAYLELAIAAAGLLSFAGLAGVRAIYLAEFHAVRDAPVLLIALRLLGATLVLLPPTFLMGGTFPILIRGVTKQPSELDQRVSRFYAINTLGAVAGTLAAGFLLLPTIGLRRTIVVAVVLNVLAGLLGLKYSHGVTADAAIPEASTTAKQYSKKSAPPDSRVSAALLLSAFAAVGATAVSYEISWTRLLSTMLGSSTYAFTLMLATLLAGFVVGSLIFEKWSAKHPATLSLFAHTQTATALAALLFLFLFRELPNFIPPILRFTNNTFSGLLLAQLAVSAAAMFPAAVIFGFNFSLVVALIARSGTAGAQSTLEVGRAYAANTAGAILAALVVGFFLLPKIGGFRVVALTAILNLLLGIFLLTRIRARDRAVLATQCAALAAIAFLGFSSQFYDKALANFSAVLYGSYHQDRLTLEEIANTEDVIFFEDGLNATITVTRSEDYVALKTNGKVDASSIDTSTQLLLGHLGAIFHPHPQRVLIIGFGGGMTASAVAKYPDVESIDCVEIEPAVLRAAPHLERLNRRVLEDSRLHIFYDDARSFIQTVQRPYDLIISEPSNPWIAGVATLYTREFYEAARLHLAPGGMFVQWVQAYGLQLADFRMILATLAPSFERLSLWHSAERDFLLLARADSSPLNFDRSRKLWSNPGLSADFHELHLTQPESWPAYFRLGDAEVRSLAAKAQINTDDRTILEYSASRAILYDPQAKTLSEFVDQLSKTLVPPDLPERDRQAALVASAESAIELESSRARKYVLALGYEGDSQLLQSLLGRVALLERNPAEAAEKFNAIGPDKTNRYRRDYWLAKVYLEEGKLMQARSYIATAIQQARENQDAMRTAVEVHRAAHDWVSAVAAEKELFTIQPQTSASDYCNLGDLELRSGDRISAAESFRSGLSLDSYSFLCHRDLGELGRASGKYDEARTHLEFVVKYFPEGDSKTYASLALTYRALGRDKDAEDILKKGKRIFPEDAFLQKFKASN